MHINPGYLCESCQLNHHPKEDHFGSSLRTFPVYGFDVIVCQDVLSYPPGKKSISHRLREVRNIDSTQVCGNWEGICYCSSQEIRAHRVANKNGSCWKYK